jgi:hypothetical protein
MGGDNNTLSSDRMKDQRDLPAGDFSSWIRQVRNALFGESGIDVACGECIGCFSSSFHS